MGPYMYITKEANASSSAETVHGHPGQYQCVNRGPMQGFRSAAFLPALCYCVLTGSSPSLVLWHVTKGMLWSILSHRQRLCAPWANTKAWAHVSP
jgi:hypothetical protein